MSLKTYLEKRGIDNRDIDSKTRKEAKELVIHTGYYKAILSDSTYHGINHNAKIDYVGFVCKSDKFPQFDSSDFCELDKAIDKFIQDN